MDQLIKLLEAAKKSGAEGVSAVFHVKWDFTVRVDFDKGELNGLDESGLRDSLAEKVDEMVGMFKTADAITIESLIEVQDAETGDDIELPADAGLVAVTPMCKKCGSWMHGDYCSDDTCTYSEWPQHVPLGEIEAETAASVRRRHSVVPRIRVNAEVHTDDQNVKVEFDAAPWFAQASDEDIMALHEIDWGGGEAADNVAEHFIGKHAGIDGLFDYLRAIRNGCAMGFECSVDDDDVFGWLEQNRPDLLVRCLKAG